MDSVDFLDENIKEIVEVKKESLVVEIGNDMNFMWIFIYGKKLFLDKIHFNKLEPFKTEFCNQSIQIIWVERRMIISQFRCQFVCLSTVLGSKHNYGTFRPNFQTNIKIDNANIVHLLQNLCDVRLNTCKTNSNVCKCPKIISRIRCLLVRDQKANEKVLRNFGLV